MRPYVPRVLHSRLGHSRKEANVPSMQGKSRLEAVFLNTLGASLHYVQWFPRLVPIHGMLDACNNGSSDPNQ